jgi:hypothetical protein
MIKLPLTIAFYLRNYTALSTPGFREAAKGVELPKSFPIKGLSL